MNKLARLEKEKKGVRAAAGLLFHAKRSYSVGSITIALFFSPLKSSP